jgi:hypothetical protein
VKRFVIMQMFLALYYYTFLNVSKKLKYSMNHCVVCPNRRYKKIIFFL